ncbi:MAG: ABC transporter permease [Clostridiales bacterium]|nr:ABC transporter permease [Clostridiales bacterium]
MRKRNMGFFLAAAGICLAWAAVIWILGNGARAGGGNSGALPDSGLPQGGGGAPRGGNFLPFGALPVAFNLAFSPLTVLAFVSEAYAPILCVFLAADLYAAEIKSGYIKWLCAAPGGSAAVYFSKLLAMIVFSAANIFALFLASLAFALILPVGGLSAAGIREALTAYAVTVVPTASVAAMLAFVATLFESRFAAIFAGAAFYAGARIAGLASGAVADASFLSYMQWHVLWVGGALPARKLLSIWMMLLSGGAAFAAAGYMSMARKAGGGARRARAGRGETMRGEAGGGRPRHRLAGSGSGSGTEARSELEARSEAGTEAGSESGSESGTEAGSEPRARSEAVSELEAGSGLKTGSGFETGSGPEAEAESRFRCP